MKKQAPSTSSAPKRFYEQPRLVEHGSVRNITGGSGGTKGDLGAHNRR